MLIDDLCDRLRGMAAARHVVDVRIGLGYTGVLLDNGGCGLAFTFPGEDRDCCSVFDQAGTLTERPAVEVALLAKAPDAITAAVGLATLNALVEPPPGDDADALDLLTITPQDRVGMVGHFHPLVGPLRQRAQALYVFERTADPDADVLSADAAVDLLPQCQVAIITATSLLNRTMDDLLALCRMARDVVILGPSTPLVPEIFARHGVTILSGVHVTDAARALRVISEGGGTRKLHAAMRKVNVRIR